VESDEVDGVVQAAGDVTEQIGQEIGPASQLHGARRNIVKDGTHDFAAQSCIASYR
jgi:hypothetical protein